MHESRRRDALAEAGGGPVWRRLSLALLVGLSGCEDVHTGVVELAWVFVDRNGDPIYPAGQFTVGHSDVCELAGRRGGRDLELDLHVELQICDPECVGGCDDEACHVVPVMRFPCDVPRGSLPDVPAADRPYLFEVGVILAPNDSEVACVDPAPTCIAVPGPRERTVWRGLVTDLQVYQFVVGVDQDQPPAEGGALDLEECGCA